MPPRCGVEAAPAMPGQARKTAQQATISRRQIVCRRAGPSTGARVGSSFIAISNERGCRLRRDSAGLTGLPTAVLLEELFLFLIRHRRAAGRVPVLVDEAGEHSPQILGLGRIGDLLVALQSLIRRGNAVPARPVSTERYILGFRMVSERLQRL